MPKQYLIKFYSLIEQHLGIVLSDRKLYLIESRLSALAKEGGYLDVASLIRKLTETPVGPLHWKAFEALTTNETSFFRDEHVFGVIRNHILPSLIQSLQAQKTLRIWSAAASTGQEAYSIALIIQEFFPELMDWNICIQGTDVSESAVRKAKEGVYTAHEISRGISPPRLARYFCKLDDGHYQLNEKIRNMVTFKSHNLVSDWGLEAKYDLIMLRNVLIYFNQDAKNRILEKIHRSLNAQHGILLLGSPEALYLNSSYASINKDNVSYYTPR